MPPLFVVRGGASTVVHRGARQQRARRVGDAGCARDGSRARRAEGTVIECREHSLGGARRLELNVEEAALWMEERGLAQARVFPTQEQLKPPRPE